MANRLLVPLCIFQQNPAEESIQIDATHSWSKFRSKNPFGVLEEGLQEASTEEIASLHDASCNSRCFRANPACSALRSYLNRQSGQTAGANLKAHRVRFTDEAVRLKQRPLQDRPLCESHRACRRREVPCTDYHCMQRHGGSWIGRPSVANPGSAEHRFAEEFAAITRAQCLSQ